MQKYPTRWKYGAAWLLVLACLLNMGMVSPVDAKKKKGGKGKSAEEVQKALEEVTTKVSSLLMKVQTRSLLSPEEAQQVIGIKYQLLDLLTENPGNPEVAKPVYQAGVLYAERESFNDAYELFQQLAVNYPDNPYGMKAKSQILQLEKRFGADYFAVEKSLAPAGGGEPKPKK